jgi:hypothetical protein
MNLKEIWSKGVDWINWLWIWSGSGLDTVTKFRVPLNAGEFLCS